MTTDFWKPATETPPKDVPLLIRICYPQGGVEFRLAMYFSAKKHIADTDYDTEWCEYDEETDTYFCPEGWYEKGASHEDITWWAMCGSGLAGITDWAAIPKKEHNDSTNA
jgi:hypothetical protein